MATISSSQDLDSAVRTAGEVFTMDTGAILTVNTDTCYHKNVTTWGSNSIGGVAFTAGSTGKILYDARYVKWVPYTGATGNVPALGSTITGATSGVTGELLGVYSSINVAPTAAGSAMPASGFLKFKSTSGNFNVSESLNTFTTCTTNGATVTGWIEVRIDSSASHTTASGCTIQSRGDWFYLGTTTGARGQQVQCPNMGQANVRIPGLWIETGVGTGVYEYFHAQIASAAGGFTTSHMGTDARSTCVELMSTGGGLLRIGNDGTNSIGKLPVSGCNIRIPNIIFTECATASRGTIAVPNSTLANRPDFTTTSGGTIDMEYITGDWYLAANQASPPDPDTPEAVTVKYSSYFDQMSLSEIFGEIVLDTVCNSNYNNGDTVALILLSNHKTCAVSNCVIGRTGTIAANDYGVSVSYCENITFTSCIVGNRTVRTNATSFPIGLINSSKNIVLTGCTTIGNGVYATTCNTVTITNHVYADWYHTTSSNTNVSLGAIYFLNCATVKLDGFSWYPSISNVHHDSCILYVTGNIDVKFRNVGTRASPIDGGSSNVMLSVITDGGNNVGIELLKVYAVNLATRFFIMANNSYAVSVINCAGDYADTISNSATAGLITQDTVIKSMGGASMYAGATSVYDFTFYNIYTSSSAGRLGLCLNPPASTMVPYITTSFTGSSGFTGAGLLSLQNLNDYVIFEYPFKILGIDSFQAADAVVTGTGASTNLSKEYAIKTTGDWSAWKAATSANLSGETIDADDGFYLKIRITCITGATTNTLTSFYILTNADTTAQEVIYPYDQRTLTLTGLVAGSEVRVLVEGEATELGGIEESDTSWGYEYTYAADTVVDIVIHSLGYEYYRINSYTLLDADASIPVQQRIDRNYVNPT